MEEVTFTEADPIDACSPLTTTYESSDVVVVAQRGGCSFGDKALNVQDANGAALVVVEATDGAIQRIGATADQTKSIGIPAMMLSHHSGEELRRMLRHGPIRGHLVPQNGMSEKWLELAIAEWPSDENARNIHLRRLEDKNKDSRERLRWLRARQMPKAKSDEL